MFGFPDYAECPVDKDDLSKSHHACTQGGPLPAGMVALDHGGREFFMPYGPELEPVRIRVHRHALTPQEVQQEYKEAQTQRITVNKTTHRIRFENETGSSVDVVIEPTQQSASVKCDAPCETVTAPATTRGAVFRAA